MGAAPQQEGQSTSNDARWGTVALYHISFDKCGVPMSADGCKTDVHTVNNVCSPPEEFKNASEKSDSESQSDAPWDCSSINTQGGSSVTPIDGTIIGNEPDGHAPLPPPPNDLEISNTNGGATAPNENTSVTQDGGLTSPKMTLFDKREQEDHSGAGLAGPVCNDERTTSGPVCNDEQATSALSIHERMKSQNMTVAQFEVARQALKKHREVNSSGNFYYANTVVGDGTMINGDVVTGRNCYGDNTSGGPIMINGNTVSGCSAEVARRILNKLAKHTYVDTTCGEQEMSGLYDHDTRQSTQTTLEELLDAGLARGEADKPSGHFYYGNTVVGNGLMINGDVASGYLGEESRRFSENSSRHTYVCNRVIRPEGKNGDKGWGMTHNGTRVVRVRHGDEEQGASSFP